MAAPATLAVTTEFNSAIRRATYPATIRYVPLAPWDWKAVDHPAPPLFVAFWFLFSCRRKSSSCRELKFGLEISGAANDLGLVRRVMKLSPIDARGDAPQEIQYNQIKPSLGRSSNSSSRPGKPRLGPVRI